MLKITLLGGLQPLGGRAAGARLHPTIIFKGQNGL